MVDTVTNDTTNILYGLIFEKGSMPLLKRAGLLGVYLDDYGARKKYRECIFFHFRVPHALLIQTRTGITAASLLNNITEFKSFYDYYETDEGMMFVFKYKPIFRQDIYLFRKGKFSEFSKTFKEIVYSGPLQDKVVDISKEIYRY